MRPELAAGKEGSRSDGSMRCRRQLSLFVPSPWRETLDALRADLDPFQAALIAAHVTLCREDEFAEQDEDAILARLQTWESGPLRLEFAAPRRFLGHGVLLPCCGGLDRFHGLRCWLLQDVNARRHEPHLTLAHPRNPRAPRNTDAALAACPRYFGITFPSVTLIEQNWDAPWQVLRTAAISTTAPPVTTTRRRAAR